jgi:hypothetical protein
LNQNSFGRGKDLLGAIIGDFGKNQEGVNLYRINGTKDEINKAIDDLQKLGCEIWQPYEFETSHKHFSVLIKLQVPDEMERKKSNG